MEKEQKKIIKQWKGTVISTKMDKTIVVRVDRVTFHSRYGKKLTASKNYKVHCTDSNIKEGDKVIFVECRPLSKDKKWKLVSKVK